MSDRAEFIATFRDVQIKFSRLYAIILSKLGLTLPQYALLNQLAAVGTLPMTQASKRLHITKPAVTSLVDRLEKKKCLKRLPHPKDRRIYLLEIQPKGIQMVRQTRAQVLRILLKAFSRFNSGEQKIISQFYGQISQAMESILKPSKLKFKIEE